jgi:hypothetical protein
MHFERKDFRGFLTLASILAFCMAVGFWLKTRDFPADTYLGKKFLENPQIGDPSFLRLCWISLGVSASLAIAARNRRFWDA